MSSYDSSSYERFRTHLPDEDTEKLIAPETHAHVSSRVRYNKTPKQHRRTCAQTVRTSVRVLALLLAITIMGVQAYSAYTWLSTRGKYVYNPSTKTNTRAWAIIDGWPTWVMLAAAVVAVVIQLSALVSHLCVCLVERHHSRSHTVSVWFSSFILIAFWIAAMVYFKLANTKDKKKSMWDIWTWSCRQKSVKGDIPWKTLCMGQEYTWIASIVVIVIEIIVLALFVYSAQVVKKSALRAYGKVAR